MLKIDGRSLDEIAEITGKTNGTVRQTILNAKQKLYKSLAAEGFIDHHNGNGKHKLKLSIQRRP